MDQRACRGNRVSEYHRRHHRLKEGDLITQVNHPRFMGVVTGFDTCRLIFNCHGKIDNHKLKQPCDCSQQYGCSNRAVKLRVVSDIDEGLFSYSLWSTACIGECWLEPYEADL